MIWSLCRHFSQPEKYIPLFSTRWATSCTVSSIWDFGATDPFISISKQLFVCVYYFREGWISHWLLFQATDFQHRPSWAGLSHFTTINEVSTVFCTSPGPGVHPILGFSYQHMMWGELMWLLSLSVYLCMYSGTKSRETPMSSHRVTSFPFVCRSMQISSVLSEAEYKVNSSLSPAHFPHVLKMSHTEPVCVLYGSVLLNRAK